MKTKELSAASGLVTYGCFVFFGHFAVPLQPARNHENLETHESWILQIIDHLTENGSMDAGLLYESPFKDIAPQGPEELFSDDTVVDLIQTIRATSDPNADSAVA